MYAKIRCNAGWLVSKGGGFAPLATVEGLVWGGGEVRGCSRGLEGWRREHQTLYRRWNWRGRIGRPKKDCNRQEETWCYTKGSIIILSLLVSHTCFWQPGIVSAVLWVCRMARHLNQQYVQNFQELPYRTGHRTPIVEWDACPCQQVFDALPSQSAERGHRPF